MKILFITEFFPDPKLLNFSGGVETRAFYIAKNLAKKHKIIVISRRKKQELKREKVQGLEIIRLGQEVEKVEARFFSIFLRLFFIIQSFFLALKVEADLVEGSNFICYPAAWLAAKIKKIPVVAWYPDLLEKEWLKRFGFFTGFFGLALEKTSLLLSWSKIIALSQETKNKLIKAGIKKSKIEVVYGGVDLSLNASIKGKNFKKPTICSIGRLVSYKNFDCLIKAVGLIRREISNINLVIIGRGPEKQYLRTLAKRLAIENNVLFKQDLKYEELLSILKGSQVFCLASEIEGFGLVTIEAASLGVPYVIADTPISREVTKGKGGFFYQKGDPKDLAKKISEILENKDLYLKLQKEAKNLACLYSWQKASLETEKVYQMVLAGIK